MKLLSWVRSLPTRTKVHAGLMTLIIAGVIGHQIPLFQWFIEDAAITFAYARNFATGEGLVPFPGAEPVEGYSNPTWMFFLAATYFVGLTDMFDVARWSQLFMVIATVPLTYLAAREGFGKESHTPLVAAAFLGASSQFAIWGGAGLENALYNLLLAGALWLMLREVRTGGWPWSAFLWMLLAITRPESPLFAAVGGLCSGFVQLVVRRDLLYSAKWLVSFLVPFGSYHYIRYEYFAWPLPNTYYAKLDHKEPLPWIWSRRPWNWTRSFFADLGQAFFLPIWILGATGIGKWRTPIALVVFAVSALAIELSNDQRWLLLAAVGILLGTFWLALRAADPDPPPWLAGAGLGGAIALVTLAEIARVRGFVPNPVHVAPWTATAPPYVLAACAIVVTIVAVGGRAWPLRLVSWSLCVTTVIFAVGAQGDWMIGYRWYALATVPGALLFASGAESLAMFAASMFDRKQYGEPRVRALAGVLMVFFVLLQVPFNVWHTWTIAEKPETAPRHVKVRVTYVEGVRDRLHYEGKWTDLDVDQGAHLWWSDFVMMDIAGLIDLPLGHHKFERSFVREYIFEERRPEFAHVHGSWASNSKLATHPEWRRDYVEIPGFPAGKSFHVGNHIRKDLVLRPGWPYGGEPIEVGNGIVVHGVEVPAAPASGREVYLEVGFAQTKVRKHKGTDDFRAILFAANGKSLVSWDAPPGYDWIWPWEWKPEDVAITKLALPLALAPGRYDLGLVLLAKDGTVIVPTMETLPEGVVVGGRDGEPARYANGEMRFVGALTVLSLEERAKVAGEERQAALDYAAHDDCEDAEHHWFLARKHREGDEEWEAEHKSTIARAMADCWANFSDDAPDRDERVRRLVKAHEWDHWAPSYLSRAETFADELESLGAVARAEERWEETYELYGQAVAVAPTRTWARRYAEEARVHRLGLTGWTNEDQLKADARVGPGG